MKRKSLYTLLVLALGLNPSLTMTASQLPDLGAEYRSTLSVNDEKSIGEHWMSQIRASGMVYQDPIVNEYVQHLGNKLTPHTSLPYSDIHVKFFAINDKSINAFAFFGGHIAVHSGLILVTTSESELAGVMSHELAHVSQQHILRQITESKQIMPLTIAGSLAAVLLGVPELMIPVLGGHGQHMLNFSRQHEQEADRVGIQIMQQANFDPQGLPSIFERMSSSLRYQSKPPEYLLTHPLYESRIADTRHRAGSFPYKQQSNSNMFHLVRARLEVQNTDNLQQLIKTYEHKLATKRHPNALEIQYGYAYALLQAGKSNEAWQQFSSLLQAYPDDLIIQLTAANIEQELHNYSAAQLRLEKQLHIYPDSGSLMIQYIELLLQTKQPAKARKILQNYKSMHSLEPIYYELARHTESMLGNQTGVYEANAEWYFLNGELNGALAQLDLALEVKSNDQKTKSRLQSRHKEFLHELQHRVKNI
jgi:predicted Zn-dependent protease